MGRKLLAGIVLVFAAQAASASSFLYTSALNGFQEVPPTGSQGIGVIQLTLDDSTLTASGTGLVVLLSGPPTGFHIHNAPFGSDGPIVLDIGASGITGNTVDFTKTLPDLASFNALKAILDAREGYFNIHTSQFQDGEIRGQIAPVPEPTALAVLGIGVLAFRRSRRRRT